eukprot:8318722-Pyramimonas_sp.AAC.1
MGHGRQGGPFRGDCVTSDLGLIPFIVGPTADGLQGVGLSSPSPGDPDPPWLCQPRSGGEQMGEGAEEEEED